MAHIVLDTRIIETSTGRYMQRLLENLNDHFAANDGNKYTALVPSAHVAKWESRLTNMSVVASDHKWYTFAEQAGLYKQLRNLKPDLVHFTMPQQPLLWTGPAVTTIHDMTLIRFESIDPGESRMVYLAKQKVFNGLLRVVMRRSKCIFTPTEFVRQDLAKFFGKKYLSKIHTTHLAGEIPDEAPEVIERFESKPFLFFVGNAFPYKNIWRIIEAFGELSKDYPDLQLLLAGKKDSFYEELEKRTLARGIKNVHFLGFISDGEKRWALQNAQAFVTASYSEGFCMPVLEAMIEGSPVVSSNASCLPEVVGDAGLLFNPDSSDDLVEKLDSLLSDEALRQDLIAKGKAHAGGFSWKKMVKQVHCIYRDVLENK